MSEKKGKGGKPTSPPAPAPGNNNTLMSWLRKPAAAEAAPAPAEVPPIEVAAAPAPVPASPVNSPARRGRKPASAAREAGAPTSDATAPPAPSSSAPAPAAAAAAAAKSPKHKKGEEKAVVATAAASSSEEEEEEDDAADGEGNADAPLAPGLALAALQLRLARERQQALLATKVIDDSTLIAELAAADAARRKAAGRKRPRPPPDADAALPIQPLRRSSRVAGLPSIDYSEEEIAKRIAASSSSSSGGAGGGASDPPGEPPVWDGVYREQAPPVAGTLRTLNAKVDYMNDTFLGVEVPMHLGGQGNQAKRAVMNAACAAAGVPTFSIMSGIQQWANAIFLFVNVEGVEARAERLAAAGGRGAPGFFDNMFLEGGRAITWFGQPTQHAGNPVILRLLHAKTGLTVKGGVPTPGVPALGAKEDDDVEAVIQPCRVCLILRIDLEPYVWAGEVTYVSHDPATHPLKFVWKLDHFDALKDKPAFRRVLAHAGVTEAEVEGKKA